MIRLVYHGKVIGAWVANDYVDLVKEVRLGWGELVWPYPFNKKETA
jgi:hypothetical protein